jgi:hypothetical protein
MASAISQVDAEMARRVGVLRAADVSEESIAQAVEALTLYYRGLTSGFSAIEADEFATIYDELTQNEELQVAQGFNLLPTATPLDEILGSGGTGSFMGFSPTDVYLETDTPISFFVGELDENIPTRLTGPAMRDVIAQRPDADITYIEYAGALHGMYVLPSPVSGVSQDVLYPNLASFRFAPGYIKQMRSWLRQKSGLVDPED